jgi:hypothetical protein
MYTIFEATDAGKGKFLPVRFTAVFSLELLIPSRIFEKFATVLIGS